MSLHTSHSVPKFFLQNKPLLQLARRLNRINILNIIHDACIEYANQSISARNPWGRAQVKLFWSVQCLKPFAIIEGLRREIRRHEFNQAGYGPVYNLDQLVEVPHYPDRWFNHHDELTTLAASVGHLELLAIMLATMKTGVWATPLIKALAAHERAAALMLIRHEHAALVLTTPIATHKNDFFIHLAIRYQMGVVVPTMLRLYPGLLDIPNPDRKTPLDCAIFEGDEQLACYLLELGADFTHPLKRGIPSESVNLAARNGRLVVLEKMYAINPNCLNVDIEQPPIVDAFERGQVEVVKFLLAKGVLIAKRNRDHLLFNVIKINSMELLFILLKQGCRNPHRYTASHETGIAANVLFNLLNYIDERSTEDDKRPRNIFSLFCRRQSHLAELDAAIELRELIYNNGSLQDLDNEMHQLINNDKRLRPVAEWYGVNLEGIRAKITPK